MRMRKAGSSPPSSSSPRPPRSAGISRFGRSGLESQDFHSGPVTTKAATPASVRRARYNLHRVNHCSRCDSRLIRGCCPSCGHDPDLDDDDERDAYIDDGGLPGDDLHRRGRFD